MTDDLLLRHASAKNMDLDLSLADFQLCDGFAFHYCSSSLTGFGLDLIILF